MRPGEKKYPHIFSPGKIGKMEVKNRIKYASTETNFNYGDGFVADKEVAYMEAQARSGAGIIRNADEHRASATTDPHPPTPLSLCAEERGATGDARAHPTLHPQSVSDVEQLVQIDRHARQRR